MPGANKVILDVTMPYLISWIDSYFHHKLWDEITYPFPNFNGCTVEVWEWISDFIPYFYNGCNYLSMLGLTLIHVSKRGPWQIQELSINSLWPGDAIWRHGARSTLAQVMACCLMAPSHDLNQCWLIIGEVPWHSSQGIILRRFEDTNQ